MEMLKANIVKKLNLNSHWQDTCGKKCNLPFLLKVDFSSCSVSIKKKHKSVPYVLYFFGPFLMDWRAKIH